MKQYYHLVIFFIIFVIYFSSAAGLYNSMDSPQFFTTEALINNFNLYIEVFAEDKHYFVFPDIFYFNGHTMGVRGYLTSILSIPFHMLGSILHRLYTTEGFPQSATISPRFGFELCVTSLFVTFTIIGLYFFYKTCLIISQNKPFSSLITIFLAFGTYFWKYSSSYIRQGPIIAVLGITSYFVAKSIKSKQSLKWRRYLLLIWAISFGIDIFLFIGLSIFIVILLLFENRGNKVYFIKHRVTLLAITLLVGQVLLNFAWYKFPFSSLTVRQPTVKEVLGAKARSAWLSTPLYPTVLEILFGSGTISSASFKNFDSLPREIGIFTSLDYAKKYNFFGLFTSSPFLLFAFILLFKSARRRSNKRSKR